MELNENITQLIIRQINNEASQQEQAELGAWLREDPAHQQEYDAYVRIWEESANLISEHNFDTAHAWQKVQKKTQPLPGVVPMGSGKVFSLKRILIAASVIICIGLAAVYFFNANQKDAWQTITAQGKNQQVTLPDGSSILLRAGSTLRYATNFENNRKTELNGEAFFEVQRNVLRPFSVITPDAVVEVLGTSFLVRHTEALDEVIVNDGRVKFAERGDTTREVILTKGQKASLMQKEFIRDTVLNKNYLSWESGHLIFNNTPLIEAMKEIGNLYNVKISIDSGAQQQANDITIQAEFSSQSLSQVLDEIRLMTGLKITQTKDSVSVHQ